MNLKRLLSMVLPLMSWSCAAPQQARLTTFNNGGYGNNWTQLRISKVDGHRLLLPKEAVTLPAGKRTVTFSLSYMRGDLPRPILAEVPVTATFAANHDYQANVHYETGFMGVLIAEQTHSLAGDPLRAGALVYSPEFSTYGQTSRQRRKPNR